MTERVRVRVFWGAIIVIGVLFALPPGCSSPSDAPVTRGEIQAFPSSPEAGKPFVNSIGMALTWIPPGTFDMGRSLDDDRAYADESPRHSVRITKGFWIGTCEVTQGEWQQVMHTNPSAFRGMLGFGRKRRPVERVNWHQCVEFCKRLSEMEGQTYRLPTEAEWEYACRAGTTEPTYGPIDQIAWCRDVGERGTHDVGTKMPNAFGCFDMLGNVSEWCLDRYGPYTSQAVADPIRRNAQTAYRCVRGGDWFHVDRLCRASVRIEAYPMRRDPYCGFRVVLSTSQTIEHRTHPPQSWMR